MYLERIKSPKDIKNLDIGQLSVLASEIRKALIKKASIKGGHLASNLGAIELTIALHYVFNAPYDKIIFDVSHQTYCHKILTGRQQAFTDIKHYDDVSGYSNPNESNYDLFHLGHTSTSIGLAVGLAKARDLNGGKENIIAVIGDSALDGGQAFEALNLAPEVIHSGLIIVINDNSMSIPENHGELAQKLNELKKTNGKSPNNPFVSLGYDYHFVANGHDILSLISEFKFIKGTKKPTIVHVCTIKGKGYYPAEKNPEKWHWAHPFDIEKGEFVTNVPKENYGSLTADYLLKKISTDKKVVVVAASTPLCIGFTPEVRKKAGNQYLDVGIAEQDALSVAAGMAKGGLKPIFATNATFYQRAYDQIEQEICINNLSVTMIVTHASVWGHNDITHIGILDMALLGNIPNLIYLAPTSWEEYRYILEWCIDSSHGPIAIRVPWTKVNHSQNTIELDFNKPKYRIIKNGFKVAIIGVGSFYQLAEQVAKLYQEKTGTSPTLINPLFVTGIDSETLNNLKVKHNLIVTIEDGILSGGFGSRIAQFYSTDSKIKVLNCGFGMNLPNRYNANEFMKENNLLPEQIVNCITNIEGKKNDTK